MFEGCFYTGQNLIRIDSALSSDSHLIEVPQPISRAVVDAVCARTFQLFSAVSSGQESLLICGATRIRPHRKTVAVTFYSQSACQCSRTRLISGSDSLFALAMRLHSQCGAGRHATDVARTDSVANQFGAQDSA